MNKLDPRTKIVMLFSISGVAMLTSNLWFLIGLLIFTILILIIGKVELSRQKKQFMGILSMLIFLFILQAIFGQAYFGAVLCVRLIIVVMSALILLTGHMRDYLLGMVQWKLPYELAFMVVLAFHFFPILRQEALDVYYSIQLRGCELKKTSLKNKLLAFKGMCIPILAGALSRAQDTAIAMEARGFRMHRKRTYMRKLTLKKKDIALMILFPVLAVGFVAGAYIYEANEDVTPNQQVTVSLMNNTKAAVSWTDDELYDGIVRVGFKKYEAECVQMGDQDQYRYTAMLTELKAGKKYKYTFGHGRDMSDEITYVHDVEAERYAFLFFGDVQTVDGDTDYEAWGDYVLDAYETQSRAEKATGGEIAFGLFSGNLVSDGAEVDQWLMIYDKLEPFFVDRPMMTAIGENEAASPESYRDMVVLPTNGKQKEEYYYCDYGDAFIITLNSCLFTDSYRDRDDYEALLAEATQWLERVLKGNDRPWVIINMHHDMTEDIYAQWGPLFEEYGVDLILSGQTDSIQMDGDTGIAYASSCYTDGANYVKVNVSADGLTVTSYDEQHQVQDTYKITK